MKMKNWVMRIFLVQGLLIMAQGCSHSSSSNTGGSSAAQSSTTPGIQLLVANSVMNDGPALYASSAEGGLIGNLYIQPRNLMLAPDTQKSLAADNLETELWALTPIWRNRAG